MAPQPLQHTPLRLHRGIRVLDLLPSFGRRDASIRCKTREIVLGDPDEQYEAISYVWGAPAGDCTIVCNGQDLLVTPNCRKMLRRLRRFHRTRTLWVDAICIDQTYTGTAERNEQIPLMGQIYHKASASRMVIFDLVRERELTFDPDQIYEARAWDDLDPGTRHKDLYLLGCLRGFQCTIPHDKVYSIYSILRASGILLSPPDYTRPIADVLEDLATSYLRDRKRLDILMTVLPCNEGSKLPVLEIHVMIEVASHYALFLLDNGYLGLAYRTCQEGDQVFLLAGSDWPFVLRQDGNAFRLVAPAYVYGVMEGQLWPEDEGELEQITLV
ncbi:hypothetical protein SLS62_005484 [Diatrype stigma]|uniref:Heterokaryon incompatibility domain-containing protein n=1 Tax=Diatrype stigma TaxID=117547 RepID=A0AAN9UR82_9PEZI